MLEDMVEDTKLKYVQLLLMKRADPNTADRDSGNTVPLSPPSFHFCCARPYDRTGQHVRLTQSDG